ncbi:hypothetical protein JCM3765_002597 [Sporobolomyces pararoseus]
MQYPNQEQYNPNHSSLSGEPSLTSNAAHSSQPRPTSNPASFAPNHQPHSSYPHPSHHHHPHEYPHDSHSYYRRGGFFAPWFNPSIPPPPTNPVVTGPPLPPHSPYNPYQYQYRFYHRCRRGRLLPLLIIGGVSYLGYRKLKEKIEGIRSEVEGGRIVGGTENLTTPIVANNQSMGEDKRRGPWGWHRQHQRLDEQRRVEAERKQNEFEAKMKEWEEAIGRERTAKKEEGQSRWI